MGLLRRSRSAATPAAVDGKPGKERLAVTRRKAKHAPDTDKRLVEEQNRLMRDRLMRAHFFGR